MDKKEKNYINKRLTTTHLKNVLLNLFCLKVWLSLVILFTQNSWFWVEVTSSYRMLHSAVFPRFEGWGGTVQCDWLEWRLWTGRTRCREVFLKFNCLLSVKVTFNYSIYFHVVWSRAVTNTRCFSGCLPKSAVAGPGLLRAGRRSAAAGRRARGFLRRSTCFTIVSALDPGFMSLNNKWLNHRG